MAGQGIQFGHTRNATWIFDLQNILELARFINIAMPFNRPKDVIAFFERPWRWTDEWEIYQEFKNTLEFDYFRDREYVPDWVLKKLHRVR